MNPQECFNLACKAYGHNDLTKMTFKVCDGDHKLSSSPLVYEAKLDLNLSSELSKICIALHPEIKSLVFTYSKDWSTAAAHYYVAGGVHVVTFNVNYINNLTQKSYILHHEARHCYQGEFNMFDSKIIKELDADIFALKSLGLDVGKFVIENTNSLGLDFENDRNLLINLKNMYNSMLKRENKNACNS